MKKDGFHYFRYMKKSVLLRITLFVFTATPYIGHTQKIEKFFDYSWKESTPGRARFFGILQPTDSGWVRKDYYLPKRTLQMKGLYKDSACNIKHGYFTFVHPNGVPESMGLYNDNKKEGLWLSYYPNGFMKDSTVYDYGEITGISIHWHNNGYVSDSTSYTANGAVKVSWFDNGSVSSAGRLDLFNRYTGKWKFFHHNSNISAEELYDNGRLVDKRYFTEDGTPMADTTDRTRPAEFTGGVSAWLKYMEKHLYWPNNYHLENGNQAELGVQFSIDENGVVKNIHLFAPFEAVFNDIVIRTLQGSPKWLPSISHNRKVSYEHKQTVNFTQITR